MEKTNPILIIIIVNWNGEKFIKACIQSALRAVDKTKMNIKLICIDNASTDNSRNIIDSFSAIEKIFLSKNIGFAAANNLVISNYKAKYFLLLNPDTIILDTENLLKFVTYFEATPEVGIGGCLLLNKDNTWQKSIGHFPNLPSGIAEQTGLNKYIHNSSVLKKIGSLLSRIFSKSLSHFDERRHLSKTPVNVDFVWGAYMFFRSSIVAQIGPLDRTFFIFGEESDFCLRANKIGWKVQFIPFTSIIHLGGQSQKQNINKIYYWHIAMYFWFFAKHKANSLMFWRNITFVIQSFLLLTSFLHHNHLNILIHKCLVELCFTSKRNLPNAFITHWTIIESYNSHS